MRTDGNLRFGDLPEVAYYLFPFTVQEDNVYNQKFQFSLKMNELIN